MHLCPAYVLFSIAYHMQVAYGTDVVTLLGNLTIPKQGEPIRLSCLIQDVADNPMYWYNSSNTRLGTCFRSIQQCSGVQPGYTMTVDQYGSYLDIARLNRSLHEGVYKCVFRSSQNIDYDKSYSVIVYAIPQGLTINDTSTIKSDLIASPVIQQCKTNGCAYPTPSIKWFYRDQGNQSIFGLYIVTNGSASSVGSCLPKEDTYTSTLNIPMYTTWTDNTDKTVRFFCGIEYPDSSRNIYSPDSGTVRFAVNLTFLRLRDVTGSELLGSVEVLQGTQVTFACITSVSRPTATVNWYIGDTQINNGITSNNVTGDYGMQYVESRLTFIPSDMEHHNKRMYCQAYSYISSISIKSSEALLFVKVNVIQAELQQSNHTVAETLNVTSWEPVTLTCVTGFSRPAPTIDWFIESQWVGNGTSLTFTAKNEDHNKTIYCSAYSIDPSRPVFSRNPRLYVKVSVTSITVGNSTTGIFVFYDGFSQKLKCTSSPSRPSPTIRWMLESQTGTVQLTDNITNTDVTDVNILYVRISEITLTLKKENRNKKIFCNGNIDGQQIAAVSRKVTIDVWYMPNKPEVQEYGTLFPWLENQNGTLQCNSIDYGNPTSNVNWTSSRGNTDTNGHLVIMGLAWSDHRKMVSCELVNRYTIDKDVHAVSEPINLNVEYSPKIHFNTTSPLTVNETKFLIVSCSATGNPNPDQIFWSGRSDGSLLRFENISRNESGTYMCNAIANSSKYGTLRNQMEFDIIVQYAPVLKVTYVSSTLQNRTSLITCEASGVPAVYTFYPWRHMWGETIIRYGLQGMPTSPSQNILILDRLSLQDMGTYVCFAENRIKGINGEFIQMAAVDLNILGVPAFLSEEENKFAGGVGHFINISIPFYSYSHVTSFMFKKNGTKVMNTSRTNTHLSSALIGYTLYDSKIQLRAQEAHLYIQNLTLQDFDSYTLILQNSQGPAEFIVTLDPFGPPQMVDIFAVIRFIENQIELYFKPGFNGGRVQTFVIEYRSTASPYLPWKNSSVSDLKETQTYNGSYFVNITQPSPGKYEYRMYSWNDIGRSPYSVVITIVIPQVPSTYEGPETSVAGIAGGISAGIVAILGVVIGIFLWRRYQHMKKNEQNKDVTGEDEESTRRHQTKAISAKEDMASGKEYERLHFTEAAATQYLQLNDIMLEENRNSSKRSPESDSYETLHPYANNDIQMYSSLKIPKISKDSEKDYENVIKRLETTAEYQ